MTKLKLIILVIIISFLGSCKISKPLSESKNWLDGNWSGIGHQIDIKEDNQWTIELKINTKEDLYNISYPSLNCSGKWELMKYSGTQATFKEVIDNNIIDCVENGIIIISKIDNSRVSFSYFYVGDKKASAFTTLEKK